MPKLVIIQGAEAGSTFNVERSAIVGRQKGGTVRIADIGASREHCKVCKQGGDWSVIDLQSRNGTIVNGRKISRHPLADGDTITIGKTDIRFEAPELAAAAAAAAPPPPAAARTAAAASARSASSSRGTNVMDRERERLRAEAAAKAGKTSAPAADDGSGIVVKEEVLQYGRREQKGGVFKEDVAQRGGMFKILMGLVLGAAFVGLVYGMVQLVAIDPEYIVDDDTSVEEGGVEDDGTGDDTDDR